MHITGDAYLKFRKITNFGFEFNYFKPQKIFDLIKISGNVPWDEMFKTFNMGWGFALVVRKEDSDSVLQAVKDAEEIGTVTEINNIVMNFRNEKIIL